MEKLLGILFCGGKGTRLGKITEYISKSFVPIYDKPVFMYGLQLLEKTKNIDEIIILTNKENDKKLRQTGYKTIIQDDNEVTDMLTGFQYIKKRSRTKKDCVLMPSDNVTNIDIDKLIEEYKKKQADFAFSIYNKIENQKLKEMGVFDIKNKKYKYKPRAITKFMNGVLAPFIISNKVSYSSQSEIFENVKLVYKQHSGYWFDIGDYDSILKSFIFITKDRWTC